jgi:hypothetical protein
MAARLTLLLAAFVLPANAAAAIHGKAPATNVVGGTGAVRISIVNDRETGLRAVTVQVPSTATLLTGTIDDPSWLGSQDGSLLDWEGTEPLAPGGRLEIVLRIRFDKAGDASPQARVRYTDGTTEEATIDVQVSGSSGGLGAEVATVIVAGAAIFLGAVAVFVVGRRRLRA